MRRTVAVAVLAVGLVSCGSRVDKQDLGTAPKPPAAPSPSAAPASAGGSTSASGGSPSSTAAAPTTTAAAAPTTTSAAPTTTAAKAASTTAAPAKDPTSFDKAGFCTAINAAPLEDIRGFAVFDKTESMAVAEKFATIKRLAPSYLDEAATALKRPVDELAAKVANGQVADQIQLQDWIMALDATTLTNWVAAQRQILAWKDANC